MSTHHTDAPGLSLVPTGPSSGAPSGPVPGTVADPAVWSSPATPAGLDERLEIAVLDAGERIAVRDGRHPAAPALRFTATDWQALIAPGPELVDLR